MVMAYVTNDAPSRGSLHNQMAHGSFTLQGAQLVRQHTANHCVLLRVQWCTINESTLPRVRASRTFRVVCNKLYEAKEQRWAVYTDRTQTQTTAWSPSLITKTGFWTWRGVSLSPLTSSVAPLYPAKPPAAPRERSATNSKRGV